MNRDKDSRTSAVSELQMSGIRVNRLSDRRVAYPMRRLQRVGPLFLLSVSAPSPPSLLPKATRTLRVVAIGERGNIARSNNRGCARMRRLISGPPALLHYIHARFKSTAIPAALISLANFKRQPFALSYET